MTGGETSAKGSGRSIESYSMYEELVKCADLMIQFGGHPMAAGLSIEEKNIEVTWSFNKANNISFDEVLDKEEKKKKKERNKNTEEKVKSHYITVDYIKAGKSIKEVVKERELALVTVMGHIQQYISEGNKVDFKIPFDEFFNEDEEKIVLKAIDEVGYNKLKSIKEIVPQEISYDAIRAIVLKKAINELA